MHKRLSNCPESSRGDIVQFEAFITLKEAAAHLALPYFKLQRFVRSGAVPTYNVHNGRRLVRLSEVNAAIVRSRTGGANG